MSRSKTDYGMLMTLAPVLEQYAKFNFFEIKKHSQYQWNLNANDILLSIYPGSGLIYATHLHYARTGLIDQTGKKYHFNNKETMTKQLDAILFAVDAI